MDVPYVFIFMFVYPAFCCQCIIKLSSCYYLYPMMIVGRVLILDLEPV